MLIYVSLCLVNDVLILTTQDTVDVKHVIIQDMFFRRPGTVSTELSYSSRTKNVRCRTCLTIFSAVINGSFDCTHFLTVEKNSNSGVNNTLKLILGVPYQSIIVVHG